MITLYEILGGAVGGIVAIATAIGIPFFKKIIFKVFESKINEKVEKALSDHNAKNDTKIHTSKVLFELEQKALKNILQNFGKIISAFTRIHTMANMDSRKKQYPKACYDDILVELSTNTNMSINKSVEDFVYIMDEDIEDKFENIYNKCYEVHTEITNLIENNNILELKNYLYTMLDDIESDFKIIKKSIRNYYNNIKII